MLRWTTVAAAAVVLGACAPPASQGGFDSPDPATRLYAIERAMRHGDRAAAPRLVEQLDSDDPAVRMLAISALERFYGRTLGYRYDQPRYLREEAIRRWEAEVGAPAPGGARRQDNG